MILKHAMHTSVLNPIRDCILKHNNVRTGDTCRGPFWHMFMTLVPVKVSAIETVESNDLAMPKSVNRRVFTRLCPDQGN